MSTVWEDVKSGWKYGKYGKYADTVKTLHDEIEKIQLKAEYAQTYCGFDSDPLFKTLLDAADRTKFFAPGPELDRHYVWLVEMQVWANATLDAVISSRQGA